MQALPFICNGGVKPCSGKRFCQVGSAFREGSDQQIIGLFLSGKGCHQDPFTALFPERKIHHTLNSWQRQQSISLSAPVFAHLPRFSLDHRGMLVHYLKSRGSTGRRKKGGKNRRFMMSAGVCVRSQQREGSLLRRCAVERQQLRGKTRVKSTEHCLREHFWLRPVLHAQENGLGVLEPLSFQFHGTIGLGELRLCLFSALSCHGLRGGLSHS